MNQGKKENRHYERYETQVKVYFRVDYKLQTRVEYQLVGKEKDKLFSKRYFGLSKNISTEGMCFVSNRKLKTEDIIAMEVYLPGDDENPVYMLGEVRWSEFLGDEQDADKKFATGVKLLTVNKQPVAQSIHFDEKNKVYWSPVLESIFGKFRSIDQKDK